MKEYQSIIENINESKEITTKALNDLGYNSYDITQFIKANILIRTKRGVYRFFNPIENVEQAKIYIQQGITQIIKRNPKEAQKLFTQALNIDNSLDYARFGIFASLVFAQEFDQASISLKELFQNRQNNSLLTNIYYYLVLLSKVTKVDSNFINEVHKELINNPSSYSRNFSKMFTSINDNDYETALKYINYTINIDKKSHKYHLTNQVYRYLIIAVLKSLSDNKEIIHNEEQSVIVPEISSETIIERNLFLEAIANNDFKTALKLISSTSNIDYLPIVKNLLEKLSQIQSLLTTKEPIKVTATEPVHTVTEIVVTSPEEEKSNNQELEPSKNIEPPTSENAYQEYKINLANGEFAIAKRKLEQYEYLNNKEGNHRNIDYHYQRIVDLEQEFITDQESYFTKQELLKEILSIYTDDVNQALNLIYQYQKLPGFKNPYIYLIEAEIYYKQDEVSKSITILKQLSSCNEPKYYMLLAKINFANKNYHEALDNCLAYNERRPNRSPFIYKLMGECYYRLYKPSKALKAYQKAQFIASQYDKTLNLSSQIAAATRSADYQRELRMSKNIKNN